jgi:hypothetical protein
VLAFGCKGVGSDWVGRKVPSSHPCAGSRGRKLTNPSDLRLLSFVGEFLPVSAIEASTGFVLGSECRSFSTLFECIKSGCGGADPDPLLAERKNQLVPFVAGRDWAMLLSPSDTASGGEVLVRFRRTPHFFTELIRDRRGGFGDGGAGTSVVTGGLDARSGEDAG